MSRALHFLADSAAEGTGSQLVYIVPVHAEPQWSPSPWLPWAIGIVLFLAAAVLAYRRATPAVQNVPRRRRRILLTGLAWAATLALMFAPQQYATAWSPFWLSLLLRTVGLFLLGTPILGALDLTLDYFGPLRRREWLAIGPLLFAVIVPATIFGLELAASVELFAQAGPGPVALAAAAAGFVWWAWLPAHDAKLAYVFE